MLMYALRYKEKVTKFKIMQNRESSVKRGVTAVPIN